MSDQPEALTPQERAAVSDGEKMLKMISEGSKTGKIVGPDGQVINKDVVEAKRDFAKEAKEAAIKRIDELHGRLMAMTDPKNDAEHDPEIVKICAVMLACFRIVFWAKVELFSRSEADTEFIEYVERYMREAVYSGPPFKVTQAIAGMKNDALPIVESFRRVADMHKRKRMGKLSGVLKRIQRDGGIALPTKSASSLFEKGFTLGHMLILHGPADAVRAATCAGIKCAADRGHGKVYYLSCDSGDNVADAGYVVLPPAWWNNAGRSMKTLLETLDPVVQDSAPLLVVEDLGKLYEKKDLALQRLYQWGNEQGAAMIVGDVVTEGHDVRMYGSIPHLPVVLSDVAGKLIVKFGSEDYPLPQVKPCPEMLL